FFQAEDGIRDFHVTGVQTCALPISIINTTEDIYIDACDPEHDGFASFDLTSIIDDILQGLTGVSVTFHESNDDAVSGSNAIPNPTDYDNTTFEEQTIYVRVTDDVTGCSTITTIEIHANLLLTATEIRNFSLCDEDNDGSEEFDLINISDVIINDVPDVTVTFYETL